MAIISKISYIDSHRVAVNTGFNINYNLPYNISNFYKPGYFSGVHRMIEASPVVEFIKRLSESDEFSASENLTLTEIPIVNDDDKSEAKNEVENSTIENLEVVDDNEITTTETETTTKKLKKKRKSKVKRDLSAAELYAGIKDTLKV